jgi:beta-lactamase regulating signal transducer with metallopeptidase domain
METDFLSDIFEGVLRLSWRGTILLLIIWFAMRLFGTRLSPALRSAYWSLVLIALIAPVSLPSSLSLHNLVPIPVLSSDRDVIFAPETGPRPATRAVDSEVRTFSVLGKTEKTLAEEWEHPSRDWGFWIRYFSIIWVVGMIVFLAPYSAQFLSRRAILKSAMKMEKEAQTMEMESARTRLGVARKFQLFTSDSAEVPHYYFGLFESRMVLPRCLLREISPEEWRVFFLFMLARWKTGDFVLQKFTGALNLIHWFNPLLWWGSSKMQKERECVAKAFALRAAHPEERALLEKVLHRISGGTAESEPVPDKFSEALTAKPLHWSFGTGLLLLLALFGLTDARDPSKRPPGNLPVELWGGIVERKSSVRTGAQEIQISGTVLDRDAKTPLEAFQIFLTRTVENPQFPIEQHTFRAQAPQLGTNGTFELKFSTEVKNYRVEIQSAGYRSLVTDEILFEEGDQKITFSLSKMEALDGRVFLPDGTAGKDVHVALLSDRDSVRLVQRGFVRNSGEPQMTVSDENGWFTVQPKRAPAELLAIHEDGFAQMSVRANLMMAMRIDLEPWARIEGVIKKGSEIADPIPLQVMPRHAGRRPFFVSSRWTDQDGRFILENLPPGDWSLGPTNGAAIPFRVEPGDLMSIQFGAAGWKVQGRLIQEPQEEESLDWRVQNLTLACQHEIPVPIGSVRSQSGVQQPARYRPIFRCKPNADGTFSIEDVPGGVYSLAIEAFQTTQWNSKKALARLPRRSGPIREVHVPEASENRDEMIIDLGALPIPLLPRTIMPLQRDPKGAVRRD